VNVLVAGNHHQREHDHGENGFGVEIGFH
jgi:hypothetical protein